MSNRPKNDALGDRMKRYEDVYRFRLPRRTYTIVRVDGRAFHTWTKRLQRPYDLELIDCMNAAALALCEEVAGARFAYVQSDEISLLATDFDLTTTQPWFDGIVQKWCSVAASIATMAFNEKVRHYRNCVDGSMLISKKEPNATFDARVFTIPDHVEVANYFVWRQQDAERNSVAMLAQHYASHKELHGKGREEQHEVIYKYGDNWAKHPVRFKHGAVVRRHVESLYSTTAFSGGWAVDDATPKFTRKRAYLENLIPIAWEGDLIERKAKAEGV